MKDSFYFAHDNNASNDDKLLAVRSKFNWEGVGLFWALLESMSRNEGYIVEGLQGGLALGFGVAENLLKNLLDFCVEINLLKKNRRGFHSERMIEQLKLRIYLSECGKRGVKKREMLRGASSLNDGGLHAGKERKGNKGKENREFFNKNSQAKPAVVFGNEKVNEILKALKKSIGIEKFADSSSERIFGLHCVSLAEKIGKDEFLRRVNYILQDDFRRRNCNKIKYFYNELKSVPVSNKIKPNII